MLSKGFQNEAKIGKTIIVFPALFFDSGSFRFCCFFARWLSRWTFDFTAMGDESAVCVFFFAKSQKVTENKDKSKKNEVKFPEK